MKRRELLAAASTAAVALSGCARSASDTQPDDTASPVGTTVPLSKYDCPPNGPTEDPVVCSHTVDTDGADIYLLTNPTTHSETPTLTLHNDSSSDLEFNPFQWTVMQHQPSGWVPVEKRSSGNGRLVVATGETHSWTFEEVVNSINAQVTLDAGTYTASIDVPNPRGSNWIRCVALVRLS
jgi:hypothetical protein